MVIGLKAPGLYIQGEGALNTLGKYVKNLGSCFLVIASTNNQNRIGTQVQKAFSDIGKKMVYATFKGHCTKNAIDNAMEIAKNNGCDAIVGIGGGKALDTAKAVATNLGGIPTVIIPTIASNDAPCSSVAVIYNEEEMVIKALMMKQSPDVVLVDTGIIAKAPEKYLVSGIGDALATYIEARACRRSGAKTMARGSCSMTALALSKLCYDTLLKYAEKALQDVKQNQVTLEVEKVVEACIYLSGIGFESGGLAAAHAIHDSLAYIPETRTVSHGEKVAFGILVQLILENVPKDEWEEVYNFLKRIGLPLTLDDLGIDTIDETQLRAVAASATVPTQFTKNIRPDFTAEEVYEAILKVNNFGGR